MRQVMSNVLSMVRTPWLRKGVPVAAVVLLLEACGLNSVNQPALTGPSTTFLGMMLSANPDIITADNRSKSTITITVTTPSGPAAGIPLAYAIFDAGQVVGLGTLSAQTGVTNGAGQATVVYTAPARTDVNAQLFIDIGARIIQGDANGPFNYHTVTIELRPAEPSQFPQVPGLTALNCNFTIEPALPGSFAPGLQVLFQDTSSDPNANGTIIRYQWNFGDGTIGPDSPDVNHAYGAAGQYTVTHVIVDSLGAQATCAQSIQVEPVSGSVGVPGRTGH
jgi:PKD repeat protein